MRQYSGKRDAFIERRRRRRRRRMITKACMGLWSLGY